MMKYITLATTLAAASAAVVPGAKKSIKLGERNLIRGEPATEALLKVAKPYNQKTAQKSQSRTRRAEENNNGLDGSYSIQFSECMDIRTYDEDLFGENYIEYTKAGQIVAEQSYVLFHVCQENECYLEAEDDLYVVDLATYLANIASYYANKRTDYCTQCQNYQDYCTAEEEVVEEEADAQEEAEGGEEEEAAEGEEAEGEEGEGEEGRKLKKKSRKLTSVALDCDQCAAYECFVDENNQDDKVQNKADLDASTVEWITAISQCQQTASYWNGMNLYVGANCDDYGDGIELAVYANEDCTWYTKENAFSDVYVVEADDQGNNINYITYAEEFIKNAFYENTPCSALVMYNANADAEDGDNNQNQNQDNNNEMSDYCKGVIQNAVSYANCGNENGDEEQQEEENNDDALAQYADWFTYDLKEIENTQDVCKALHSVESFTHVYDSSTSGSWYERDKKGQIIRGETKKGMSGGAIAGIVIGVLALVGLVAGAVFMKKNKKTSTGSDYQGGALS